MERYQRDIGKIYIVVALSCMLLTASFYLFGFKPLSEKLRTERAREIVHFLDSGLWLLQEVIDKHYNLALQSASRTAIRNKQIAYLKGDVSREELAMFSAPKLADAMKANQEIVGISRYDPQGELLFTVGQRLPDGVASTCELAQLREIRMLGPMRVGGTGRKIIYCSPIIDRNVGHVGADILIVDDAGIERVVNVSKDSVSNYGIVHQEQIIYWPRELNDTVAHGVLEVYLSQGQANEDYIIESRPVEGSDWRLYTLVNKTRFFSGMNSQMLVLLSVVLLVTFFVIALTVLALRPVIRVLLREKQLFELAHRDGLTGLYNHAYMQEFLDRELERSRRHGHPISVLMFDIDHFKKVNDTYGHQAGDEALIRISDVVAQTVRKTDLVARYGGEEFMVILPETGTDGAGVLAERLRMAISEEEVFTQTGSVRMTISVGIVTCDDCADSYDKPQLINAADRAMYESKSGGRNMVTAVTLSAPT